ncbi:MAG: CotH kinase family protein [Lachnospiraceae bacterium]|nr:CotH kinase family protein [Lachnospiraceae bacterium]
MKKTKVNILLPIIILLLLCGCSAVEEMDYAAAYQDRDFDLFTACRVSSDDRKISVTWNGLDKDIYETVNVEIYENENKVFDETCTVNSGGTTFTRGTHSQKYKIIVSGNSESYTYDRLFLDYRKLPKLPIIEIQTSTGQDPGYEFAEHVDDTNMGITLRNKESLDALVNVYGIGTTTISEYSKVRVRGNASNTSYNGKVSYRLKLDHKCELLPQKSNGNTRHWVLLSVGNSLNTFIGDHISRMVNMDYYNEMIFVNLMMNGDWKGCYCLTPAVTRSNMKDQVAPNGYIIENDVYYWSKDGAYFKTEDCMEGMGYTFKYPEISDPNDPLALGIQNYLQEFEDYLYSGDDTYREYIDEVSFAKWLLVRDVMGEGDPVGANVYYYKYDFNPDNPTSTKLKMGPVWDFDTMGGSGDDWCGNRARGVTYFETLMMEEEFRALYIKIWDLIKPDLIESISGALNKLDKESLDESWHLEESRWDYEIESFDEQYNTAVEWFESRTDWIDKQLFVENAEMGLLSESDFTTVENEVEYCIDSVEDADELKMIKGWAILKNAEYLEDNMCIAIYDDSGIHITEPVEREDVQTIYNLNYNDPGFYVYLKDPVDYKVVILDMQNRIMYK